MIVTNTWLEQHSRRNWTWECPDKSTRNQIDFILINNRLGNSVLNTKVYPGADCCTDYNPVIAKLRVRLKKVKKAPTNIKLDFHLLKSRNQVREKYKVAVRNRLKILESIDDIDEKWEKLKEAITESATEIIP